MHGVFARSIHDRIRYVDARGTKPSTKGDSLSGRLSLTLDWRAQLPGRALWGLLVRIPSIGGAENAACFACPHDLKKRCSEATHVRIFDLT